MICFYEKFKFGTKSNSHWILNVHRTKLTVKLKLKTKHGGNFTANYQTEYIKTNDYTFSQNIVLTVF